MMKRLIVLVILSFLFFSGKGLASVYSDNDILIDRMVDKGLLSPLEADLIRQETQSYVAEHMARGKMISSPGWVQFVQLTGEGRLRYEREKKKLMVGDSPAKVDETAQLRLRLGLIAQMNEKLVFAGGVTTSSGNGDPRSTSVKTGDSSNRGEIRLDHVYAEYSPAPWFSMIGGKYGKGKYLWTPTDMIWDSDINPEGASLHFEKRFAYKYTVFVNAGRWVIDTITNRDNPDVVYAQAGAGFEGENFDVKLAGVIYDFNELKGKQLDYTACSNSGLSLTSLLGGGTCSGVLTYDYRSKGLSAEAGYRHYFNETYKRLALFGEYIINDGDSELPKDLDEGWAYGVKLGDLKVAEPNEWQLKYQYTYLQKDAFPDIYPSSNRWGGQTGVKGHNIGLNYALSGNTLLGLGYHRTERLHVEDPTPQSLYQVDLTFKF